MTRCITFAQLFQRLEEVKNKSRVFSDYENSLLVRLLVPFQPRKIRNYQVGNGSLTGNDDGRIIAENHYLKRGVVGYSPSDNFS